MRWRSLSTDVTKLLLCFCDAIHFKECFFLFLHFFFRIFLIFSLSSFHSSFLFFLFACQFPESWDGESQKIYLCEHLFQTWKQNALFASSEEKILYKNSRLEYLWTLNFTNTPPPPLSQSENLQSVPLLSPQMYTPLDVNTTALFPMWNCGSTVMELQGVSLLFFFFIHRFPWQFHWFCKCVAAELWNEGGGTATSLEWTSLPFSEANTC